jgi:hypothetical protein
VKFHENFHRIVFMVGGDVWFEDMEVLNLNHADELWFQSGKSVSIHYPVG